MPASTVTASRDTEPVPRIDRIGPHAPEYLTDPLLVEVTGQEFVWHFRYAGPDGILDTDDDAATDEELHLPCEHEIRFVVHSADYIYYFSVPELKLRQISVPELTFEKSFRTDRTGDFEMPVDPMCGMRLFHDRPMGRVVVQPKPEFVEWLRELPAPTTEVHTEN